MAAFQPAAATPIGGTLIVRQGTNWWLIWTNSPALWRISTSTNLSDWEPYLQKLARDPIPTVEIRLVNTNEAKYWLLEKYP